jgi:hypothetical protein
MADSDDSMLGVSSLAGLLILVSLFITWYRSGDPLVSPNNLIFSILLLAYADVWVF